ncbi:hypothetical protein CVT26_005495 [Gymnopilus dilepis]|uniref:Uncharacterized protein n=1 Tax=Gymnopilus dilepis TaxID=231916 RepID=A0A409YT44_9AGAR|nr:hypothetical protein CVT26_005495 [Gymnopilus dilepis]
MAGGSQTQLFSSIDSVLQMNYTQGVLSGSGQLAAKHLWMSRQPQHVLRGHILLPFFVHRARMVVTEALVALQQARHRQCMSILQKTWAAVDFSSGNTCPASYGLDSWRGEKGSEEWSFRTRSPLLQHTMFSIATNATCSPSWWKAAIRIENLVLWLLDHERP